MPKGIAFIDTMPTVDIEADGVLITASSGGLQSRYLMSRSMWRRYLECEVRRLNAFEMAERADMGRVIPMRKRN